MRFTSVKENYGSGYSSSTGKFTCSHPGLYFFSTSLTEFIEALHNPLYCYIHKNNATLIQTHTYIMEDNIKNIGATYETSAFIVVHLSQGDQVYVNCTSYFLYKCSSFSGFLVQSD